MPRFPDPNQPLYFDADKLADPAPESVCWLDIMGSQSTMELNWRRSANYMGRLHSAALICKQEACRIYPVMDGVYIASPSQESMLVLVRGILAHLAYTFLHAQRHEHRFFVRGGLSFGTVIHGSTISAAVNREIAGNEAYRCSLLFGMPMIHAFQSEHDAPPFGVALHPSTRVIQQGKFPPLNGRWFVWHIQQNIRWFGDFKNKVEEYFEWCYAHSLQLMYNEDRISTHRKLCREYLAIERG